MYFDGEASSWRGFKPQSIILGKVGVGLVFLTLNHGVLMFSYHSIKPCNDNKVEYEALIVDLELTISLSIKSIDVYSD